MGVTDPDTDAARVTDTKAWAAIRARASESGPSARAPQEAYEPRSDGDTVTQALNAELSDKGFLLTSTEDIINWARTGSLHWMTFGLACCAVEMMHTSMPRYDHGTFWHRAARIPAPVGPDDRGRHPDQQDGSGPAQGL